mgnify:CR=1 FL=1
MNEWFETHPFLKQMRRRLSVELAVCLLLFCGVFLAARYAGWRQRGRTPCLGRKAVVFLDAGHGDFDPGKVSVDGSLEKDINLEIAKKLREELVESGYRVILTRETDIYMTKEQRAEAANRYGADAFVSIHQNTYEEEEPTGIETWYDGTDPSRDSRRLALLIR